MVKECAEYPLNFANRETPEIQLCICLVLANKEFEWKSHDLFGVRLSISRRCPTNILRRQHCRVLNLKIKKIDYARKQNNGRERA